MHSPLSLKVQAAGILADKIAVDQKSVNTKKLSSELNSLLQSSSIMRNAIKAKDFGLALTAFAESDSDDIAIIEELEKSIYLDKYLNKKMGEGRKQKLQNKLLRIAIGKNKKNLTRWLLDHGTRINEKSIWNDSPLMHAARCAKDDLSILQLLLDRKADINYGSNYRSALTSAVEGKNLKAMELLLNRKAALAGESHPYPLLHVAARENFIEGIDFLLKKGINVDQLNSKNHTALTIAIEQENKEVATFLMSRGARASNAHLEVARFNDENLGLIVQLIEAGAPVNRECIKNSCAHGHKELTNLLLKKGALAVGNVSDYQILYSLISNSRNCSVEEITNRCEILKQLLNNNVQINPHKSDHHPLFLAIALSSEPKTLPLLKMLLENGADYNATDYVDHTVMDYAIEMKRKDAIALLAPYKPKMSFENRTALFMSNQSWRSIVSTLGVTALSVYLYKNN